MFSGMLSVGPGVLEGGMGKDTKGWGEVVGEGFMR